MRPVEEVLETTKSIAVVGYSANAERPSHWISNYLEEQGYRVFRVNPVLESTAETPIYASLADLTETVDMVDVFRAPPHVPAIVDEAMAHGAKVIWLQPGAENDEAAAKASAAGLDVYMEICLYAKHKAWKAGQLT